MNNIQKIGLAILVVTFIGLLTMNIYQFVFKNKGPIDNTIVNELNDGQLDNLQFSEVVVTYLNGQSSLSFNLEYNGIEPVELDYVLVTLYDEEDEIVSEYEVYVGTTLATGESFPINLTIAADFSNVVKASYKYLEFIQT